jgi:hypothetical protein
LLVVLVAAAVVLVELQRRGCFIGLDDGDDGWMTPRCFGYCGGVAVPTHRMAGV